MSKCNYCVNKSQCDECRKDWKDKFIPSADVKQYFRYSYVGRTCGFDGWKYVFDNLNQNLVNTHSIVIEGKHYCPYCGESMYCIQDKEILAVVGYCCICDGARSEIEYEKEKAELERKHEIEMSELRCKYSYKLKFDSKKLLEIKQEMERKHLNFFRHDDCHFTTLNGKPIEHIDDIVR